MATAPLITIVLTIIGTTFCVVSVAAIGVACARRAGLPATLAPTILFATAAIVIVLSAFALGFKGSYPPVDGHSIHYYASFWFVLNARYPSMAFITFGSIALVYALWPTLTKRGTLDTWIGQLHFWVTFMAFELAFSPFERSAQHSIAFDRIETIALFCFVGSLAIGIVNVAHSLTHRLPRG